MNNMGFFNPFGSSGSGGGGGGGSTANYSVKAITDDSGQVSYKLTKNGTAVGDVISFNGSNMLVSYGGELVVLNSAIAGIEEALDKTYNFTTFTELEIDTHNKTLTQITDELLTKNLPQNTIVTGQIYTDALPFSGNGEAEVLVNRPAFWWTCKSLTTAPYSWTALTADQSLGGVIYDWTPSNYELPTASSSTLGGVKVGENVQIASDGTISVITTKGDTGIGIASITKTSSSGLNDIYTITYTDSTTSTFTVTNGATITSGSIGQTGHLILTMSDGRTVDAGVLPTDNEVEVTTTSSQPADPNVELWVDLSTQQTLSIPEISDSSISSTQDTWSCKKIYDEQQRQEEEIGVVANAGVKNLLDVQRPTTTTRTSYTPLANGGVELSCSNATWTSYAIADIPVEVGKEYTITFLLDESSGTSNFYFFLRNVDSSGTNLATKNYGSTTGNYEVSFTPSNSVIWLGIYLNNSATAATATAKLRCMIRPASITDSTFQPYAKTNRELTVAEDEDRTALVELANAGAKNVFKNTAVSKTYQSVTFTVNDDGTVSLSGTAATAVSVLEIGTVTPPAGSYIVSGCPAGGSWSSGTNKYRIRVAKNGAWAGDDIGNGRTITVNGSDTISLQINSGVGVDTAGLVFKPMIRRAEITDDTFVPYAPTNRELYEMKADASDLHAILPNITSSTTIKDYVDSLSKGVYTAFIANVSNPSDSPINANCFVNIYVYSATTAAAELIPISSNELTRTYTMRKIAGTWQAWYKFEGTVVT